MRIQKSKIRAEITGGQAIVRFLSPSVREMSEVQKIADEIEEVAYNYKISVLVINFAGVKQLTSSFLSRLVTLNRALRQTEIGLRLCGMSPEVKRVFKICKLEKIIPLFGNEDKALRG